MIARISRQGANGGLVAKRELIGAHAGVLVGQRGDGAVQHHDDVIAELGKLLVLPAAEALAEAHQHQQRTDTPGNAEHGEKAAQLVGHDGAKDLAERVREDFASCFNNPAEGRRRWTGSSHRVRTPEHTV